MCSGKVAEHDRRALTIFQAVGNTLMMLTYLHIRGRTIERRHITTCSNRYREQLLNQPVVSYRDLLSRLKMQGHTLGVDQTDLGTCECALTQTHSRNRLVLADIGADQ